MDAYWVKRADDSIATQEKRHKT